MFDLETALAAWRRSLEYNPAFDAEDIDELERHLRDQFSDLVRSGMRPGDAFDRALREMGSYGAVEVEYRKVYWGKRHRRGELLLEIGRRVSMMRNYLKLACRNLIRHAGYSGINIFGLAVGVAACLLILLYVRYELSYDGYHEKAARIYRITSDGARTPPAAAPALSASYPHVVERAVRFWPLFAPAKVRRDEIVFVENGGVFADPEVFSIFSWPMLAGSSDKALAAPNSIVLTRSMAEKYFGSADPLGKTLQFWGSDMTVTGVVEDVPPNSHFQFDFLVSFSNLYGVMDTGLNEEWGLSAFYTYVLARQGQAAGAVEKAARDLFSARRTDSDPPIDVQPLRHIYLHSHLQGDMGPRGNVRYLFMLVTAAALVLVLACVNFTNLTTARAATRTKEIGVRKVLGAHRRQLVGQFIGETVMLSVVAVLAALLLAGLALPAFSQIAGTTIGLRHMADPVFAAGAVGLALLVGLTAGSYPALFLSGFKPARILRGAGGGRVSSPLLRKALVVFQFTVATALSIWVVIVYMQLGYIQNKDMGFDRERVLVLDGDRFPLVREALREVPGVVDVAGAPRILGGPLPRSRFEAEGIATDSASQMMHLGATAGYIETMGMDLVAGRSFLEGSAADESEAYVLNETAVRVFGWGGPAKAVGKSFGMFVPPMDGGEEVWREGRVVGVVRDFHHDALYREIEPVAMHPSRDLNLTFVRIRQADAKLLGAIAERWKHVNPDAPFNYSLLDDHLRRQYDQEHRLRNIMGAATGLAVLIASLGLFGLAAFTAGRRRKEIGVRKVLGASSGQIFALLSGDLMKLVGLSAVIAVPPAYIATARWLGHFAYHIDLGAGVFVLSGAATMFVAFVAVSYQAIHAALADPVKSLRYE